MKFRPVNLLFPLLLCAFPLGFCLFPLAIGEVFFYWDNAQQHVPHSQFLNEALSNRTIPEWWPAVGLGFPTIAEGTPAHFHPVHLLTQLLLPFYAGQMVEVAIYLTIAALSTYFFLTYLKIKQTGAFVGAITFIFGSYSLVSINNIVIHRGLFLFPLAILLAHIYVTRNRSNWADKFLPAIFVSLVFAVQFLAGHPAMALVTVIGTSAYILCCILQRSIAEDHQIRHVSKCIALDLSGWILATVFALGLAAVQIMPMANQIDQSIRAGGLTFQYAVVESLPVEFRFLYQIFFPYAYQLGEWLPEKTSWGSYFNQVPYKGIYLGALPAILAAFGVWLHRGSRDPAWSIFVLGVVGLLLSLGAATPLYPALWSMPGLNGLRFPFRFMVIPTFALSCLAAIGLHRLQTYSKVRKGILPAVLLLSILAVGILYIALSLYRNPYDLIASNISISKDYRFGVPLSFALLSASLGLCGLLLITRHKSRKLVVIVCLIFVLVDLAVFRHKSNYGRTVPLEDFLEPPLIAEFLLRDESQFRVMSLLPFEEGPLLNKNKDLSDFMKPNTSALWGIDNAGVFAALVLKRNHAVYESLIWEISNNPKHTSKLLSYLGALNVKYVVAPNELDLYGLEPVFHTEQSTVWKNTKVLPRVFLASQLQPEFIEERDEWFYQGTYRRLARYHEMVRDWYSRVRDVQILDNLLDQEVDFGKVAIVDGKLPESRHEMSTNGKVTFAQSDYDSLRFIIGGSHPTFAVISYSYHPGWTALVNGKPVEIYRTNYMMMGIPLPAGESEVVLKFSTPGLKKGAWLSLFCGILVLLSCYILYRRKLGGPTRP